MDCYKDKNFIKVVKLTTIQALPDRATPNSALDLSSALEYDILPNQTQLISTGIKIQLPSDTFGVITGRSSIAEQGILIHPGTIDNDYRGELKIILHNLTNTNFKIHIKQKLAQLLLHTYHRATVREVNYLDPTIRGENGFGSSTRISSNCWMATKDNTL